MAVMEMEVGQVRIGLVVLMVVVVADGNEIVKGTGIETGNESGMCIEIGIGKENGTCIGTNRCSNHPPLRILMATVVFSRRRGHLHSPRSRITTARLRRPIIKHSLHHRQAPALGAHLSLPLLLLPAASIGQVCCQHLLLSHTLHIRPKAKE